MQIQQPIDILVGDFTHARFYGSGLMRLRSVSETATRSHPPKGSERSACLFKIAFGLLNQDASSPRHYRVRQERGEDNLNTDRRLRLNRSVSPDVGDKVVTQH